MKTIDISCAQCGAIVTKPLNEHTRSTKKGMKMFCNNNCGAVFSNASRTMPDEESSCELCSALFTRRRLSGQWTRFCSPSCASKGSYNEARQDVTRRMIATGLGRKNLQAPHLTLKAREAWKYTELAAGLVGVAHEFEFPLGKSVYDLALFATKTLVEFDGADHNTTMQSWKDRLKDIRAKDAGYSVVRIQVKAATVIPFSALSHIKYARQLAA